ncbi:carboxymuconolactone decarboxylase family protein [Tessaracoccus oleiagri]|uniref:Alkylhydroperoxidase AhpD family core domain-containing protein n=1 Tax=Tessaracoccus oleiagri TaxID=686624 RepID=A0A1G9H1Q2_9ACTN|nr:carboxymuconolactone decarboxylase family protein [Tessaracoccus oleiagri]SDL06817.1 alkylhydroperoxidase AhpD family core domain-containing protein [Tessaracoccus oleiagri]
MNDRIHLRKNMAATSRAQYAVTDTIIARAEELGVSRAVLELAFVHVSQLNGCAYCVNVHVGLGEKAYRTDGLDDATISRKFALAPGWRDAGAAYTELEQAALEVAEYVTLVAERRIPDDAYERLRELLGDDVLSLFLMGCINMNVFNRIHLLSGTPVGQP